MAVLNDFECLAHGVFEARTKGGAVPKCPKGCSKGMVKLVRLQPPGFVSGKTRKADGLVREMATMQGLSDISTSPSRPGGSVADRNRKKNGAAVSNESLAAIAQARAGPISVSKALGALTHKENALAGLGMGNTYNASEWKPRDKEGKGPLTHVGRPPPRSEIPMGSTGVSIDRVRGRKR